MSKPTLQLSREEYEVIRRRRSQEDASRVMEALDKFFGFTPGEQKSSTDYRDAEYRALTEPPPDVLVRVQQHDGVLPHPAEQLKQDEAAGEDPQTDPVPA